MANGTQEKKAAEVELARITPAQMHQRAENGIKQAYTAMREEIPQHLRIFTEAYDKAIKARKSPQDAMKAGKEAVKDALEKQDIMHKYSALLAFLESQPSTKPPTVMDVDNWTVSALPLQGMLLSAPRGGTVQRTSLLDAMVNHANKGKAGQETYWNWPTEGSKANPQILEAFSWHLQQTVGVPGNVENDTKMAGDTIPVQMTSVSVTSVAAGNTSVEVYAMGFKYRGPRGATASSYGPKDFQAKQ